MAWLCRALWVRFDKCWIKDLLPLLTGRPPGQVNPFDDWQEPLRSHRQINEKVSALIDVDGQVGPPGI